MLIVITFSEIESVQSMIIEKSNKLASLQSNSISSSNSDALEEFQQVVEKHNFYRAGWVKRRVSSTD